VIVLLAVILDRIMRIKTGLTRSPEPYQRR